MNHFESHRRRQRQRRPPRRQLTTIGMLGVAVAFAIHTPTLASAFAPPLSTQIRLSTHDVSARRKGAVAMNAKKRRKKSESAGDDNDKEVSYRESAKKYSSQNNNDDKADDETNESEAEGVPKQTTLSGGPSLIFEMARRMLVWDDEMYESGMLNDAGSRKGEGGKAETSPSSTYLSSLEKIPTVLPSPSDLPQLMTSAASTSPPRWRPSAIRQQSISNINPSFRTSSPIMTSAGYAGILRRNSRKKNKPSMWRHCLRVYDRMAELENYVQVVGTARNEDRRESGGSTSKESQIPGVGTNRSPPSNPSGTRRKKKRIRRSTAHHEAALVAASKLGMWEEAILIYRGVESSVLNGTSSALAGAVNGTAIRRGTTRITDNMILSVISSCVKGSKVKHTTASSTPSVSDAGRDDTINATESSKADSNITLFIPPPPSRPMMRALTVKERRKPLDMARDIILLMEAKHDIPLVSRHINPLASAYNRLGLRSEAAALINDHLEERMPPPPAPTKRTFSKRSKHWKEKQGELISDNPGFEGVKLVDWSEDDLDDDDDDDEYTDGYEEIQLNIHQMNSKDRASYSLLVQGAAIEGDWTSAVQELQRMTDAGFHPNSRNLNSWNEVMERGCRPSGNGDENGRRRSWKNKRDGMWLSNLR